MNAPAGWYPDPSDASAQRWWDGTQWTTHSSPAAPAAPQYAPQYGAPQYAPQYGANSVPPKVAADTNTLWIWIAIAVSVVPLVSLLLFDWSGYAAAMTRLRDDPTVVADLMQWQLRSLMISVLGWVAAAAYIVLSWLDWRELRRRGIPAPFHWAWSFLGLLVYTIGRTVVLKRRTVSGGWPPLWALIAVSVISIIVSISLVFTIVEAMMHGFTRASIGS